MSQAPREFSPCANSMPSARRTTVMSIAAATCTNVPCLASVSKAIRFHPRTDDCADAELLQVKATKHATTTPARRSQKVNAQNGVFMRCLDRLGDPRDPRVAGVEGAPL